MEIYQLNDFFAVLLAICACIVAISGAIAAVIKFWKWAHKTSEENAQSLGDVMKWLESDKKRIESLERNQTEAVEQNKLLLKAVVCLMSHELDGNHTKQLTETRDKIQDYLIER